MHPSAIQKCRTSKMVIREMERTQCCSSSRSSSSSPFSPVTLHIEDNVSAFAPGKWVARRELRNCQDLQVPSRKKSVSCYDHHSSPCGQEKESWKKMRDDMEVNLTIPLCVEDGMLVV